MKSYSELVDRILRAEGLLRHLRPQEPLDLELLFLLRSTPAANLAGSTPALNAANLDLVRGGLFYALDALEEGHRIFQDASGDLGAYWHGMMHRREGDFDNARYWFRRAGSLACFNEMHRIASPHSSDMAKQLSWDPLLLTYYFEQQRFGAEELTVEAQKLQQDEFEGLFDYTWRQSLRP